MKIDATLFKIATSHGEIACGTLLIAEPLLSEPHFKRSVVYIIEHTPEENSMGLVLNRPLGCYLHEVIEGVSEDNKIELFSGGPVDGNRLFYIHTLGEIIPNSIPLGNDLYIGGELEAVVSYVNSGNSVAGKLRFFLGYSGWEQKQLASELEEGVWVIANNKASDLILKGKGNSYWRNWVKAQGEAYSAWLIYPKSAHYN